MIFERDRLMLPRCMIGVVNTSYCDMMMGLSSSSLGARVIDFKEGLNSLYRRPEL
jgi:hypothetical protein